MNDKQELKNENRYSKSLEKVIYIESLLNEGFWLIDV